MVWRAWAFLHLLSITSLSLICYHPFLNTQSNHIDVSTGHPDQSLLEYLISIEVKRPGVIWMEPTIILRGGGYPPLPFQESIFGEACLTVFSMPILEDPKWQSLNPHPPTLVVTS